MRLFSKLRTLRQEDSVKIVTNQAILADATSQHQLALARLEVAERQAAELNGMDRRNHYSESLTHAFRGKPA